ncbi:replication initiation protein RepM (plasmid) [Moraxella bovis]|uniref:Replication initiation protein RepM n=1 Tax=Moraxella bovis TaxID=476 RepID=Q5KTA4_MORBO|nr:replication initiation protein RepM [Moraxella bovis]AWY21792.1 RepB family plasmid replication initiator protein [Moraxella bovis]UYZ77090.1 replication initiation protein RepM [Moraxella bovis]UYZ79762.1 replication initiation protein RepM [Moraxella bovis]UYZ82524.1 replication initiation protein RepM [Moraxella bovis]UYZ88249.1 replication initiation protein RepM [Moraxella bovis]
MNKNLVVKDNALINASYNLELVEQRLILLAVVEARRTNQEIKSDDFLTICAENYINEFGVHRNVAYQALKDACSHLFERRFTYQKLTPKGNKETITSRWVQSVSYVENEAIVRLKFSDDVAPLITLLEKNFTSYELEQVAGLTSKYAVRLYEIIIAWRTKGRTPMFDIDELRNRLGVINDEYPRMETLKRKVIDFAVKQVNDKTDIDITYEQHKNGRKIVGFTFVVTQKSKGKLTISKAKDKERDANTVDIFDSLTDKEREIANQKNIYADNIGAGEEHRNNLIKQALEQYRQAELETKKKKEREKAEKQAKKAKEKIELDRAKDIFEKIKAEHRLINMYLARNIDPNHLQGLQQIRYNDGDFAGVFEMEQYKFEKLTDFRHLNLDFLQIKQ